MLITLPLYILRELVKALFAPLFIYSFIILPFILGNMIRQNVGVMTIMMITPLIFPYIAGFVLPPTIITGTVLCYGRLNNDNEYWAAQAGGIWPGWTMIPAILVGLIATLFTLYLNESVLTYSTSKISSILLSGQVELIERKLSRQGVVQIGNNHLYRFPKDKKGRTALDITIYENPQKKNKGKNENPDYEKYSRVSKRIVALNHKIEVKQEIDQEGKTRNSVIMNLEDCTIEYIGKKGSRFIQSKKAIKKLYIDAKSNSVISRKRVACWGIDELRNQREAFSKKLAQKNIGVEQRKDYKKSYKKYTRELHKRLSLSFSCLLFAIVGTLVGMALPHGDRSGRFVAGFGVAVGYFIIFLLCRALFDLGSWILWMPNVALLLLSAYLWHKLFQV